MTGIAGKLAVPALTLAWAVAVICAMGVMIRYQMTPTAPASASVAVPRTWPDGIDIVRRPGRYTAVMALHPQCPCSRASVHELMELTARTAGRMDAVVLFVDPSGAPADWLNTDLLAQAKQIPDVTVMIDRDGADARQFGATTSGQVVLFDPQDRLVFSGGITDGRGYQGDNTGLTAMLDLVRDGKSTVSATAVYGCPLGVCPLDQSQGKKP